jgi:hypothetical protein
MGCVEFGVVRNESGYMKQLVTAAYVVNLNGIEKDARELARPDGWSAR